MNLGLLMNVKPKAVVPSNTISSLTKSVTRSNLLYPWILHCFNAVSMHVALLYVVPMHITLLYAFNLYTCYMGYITCEFFIR
jgi:hypothetical protein